MPEHAFNCVVFFGFTSFRIDPFTKKDWYDVKAPRMFVVRQIGKTLVTRTQGTSKSCLFAREMLILCDIWQNEILLICNELVFHPGEALVLCVLMVQRRI